MTTRRPGSPSGRLPAVSTRAEGDGVSRARSLGSGRPRDDLLRPQAPVRQAVVDAGRAVIPSGLGLDSQAVRRRMVERLQADGVSHPAVLAAMAAVPRHEFVDSALAAQAYEDTSLPIGLGQTISKPSVVARMLAHLMAGANACRRGELGPTLEIGTGCGYQAALLAQLSRQVVSVERLQALHEAARQRLQSHRGDRIRLVWADGMLGHPPNAPYDSIIAAAGGAGVPSAWLEQLAVGGRLVAPVHEASASGHVLLVVDRHAHGYAQRMLEAVHFVPLKSGAE